MAEDSGSGTGVAGRYDTLPRRVRRRLLLLCLLRALLSAIVLVALYYVIPLDGGDTIKVGAGLVGGLLVFAVVVIVQALGIMRSRYPRLRAVEAVATAVPLFLLVFAADYTLLSQQVVGSFSEALNRTGALYYTVTVFSTVGFGDITPRTGPARIATMLQMLADLVVFGVVARLLVDAVGAGLRRRDAASAAGPDAGPRAAD